MEIATLTARLEADIARFQQNLAAADAAVAVARGELKKLEAASAEATATLNKVKVSAGQALETDAALQTMKRSVSGVSDAAMRAANQLSDVKLGSVQAAETVANSEIEKRALKAVEDQAIKTRVATNGSGGRYDVPGPNFLAGALPGGSRARPAAVLSALGLGLTVAPTIGPAAAGASLGATAGLGALLGGVGTLALAFHGLNAAAFTTQKGFEALTPAQKDFVTTLRSLDAGLGKTLGGIAQSTVLPGLTAALHQAFTPASTNALSSGVRSFGGAISGGAQQFGQMFGSTQFATAFGAVLQADARYLRDMIDGATHLTSAFVHLQQAAIPLTDWMDKGLLNLAKWADRATQAGQASGRLAAFFDRAKRSLEAWGSLLGSVGRLFGSVFNVIGFENSIKVVNLLRDAIQGLANFINANQNVLKSFFDGLVQAAGDLKAVLGPLASTITRVVQALNQLVSPLSKATNGIIGMRGAIDGLLALMGLRWISGLGAASKAATGLAEGIGEAGIAGAAVGATAKVGLLRGALLGLARLGPLIIPIAIVETLINKDAIDGLVTGALNGAGLGFLTGDQKKFGSSDAMVQWAQQHQSDKGMNGDLARKIIAQTTTPGSPLNAANAGSAAKGAAGAAIPSNIGQLLGGGLNANLYGPLAASAAAKYGVPVGMFEAQIKQESGFNPNALSSAGARGIAQFMPATAAGYGINPDDPNQALPAAAKMMAGLYNKYHDWGLALAAYNAGGGTVDKYLAGKGTLPTETTNYVQSIMGSPLNATFGSLPNSAFATPKPLQGTGKSGVLPAALELAISKAASDVAAGGAKGPLVAALKAGISYVDKNVGGLTDQTMASQYYQERTALYDQLTSLDKPPTGGIPKSGLGLLPAGTRNALLSAQTRMAGLGSVTGSTPFSTNTLRAAIGLSTQLQNAQDVLGKQLDHEKEGSKLYLATKREILSLTRQLASAEKDVGEQLLAQQAARVKAAKEAIQDQMARILGVTGAVPGVQSLETSLRRTEAHVAASRKAGDTIPKSTLNSLTKIHEVLTLALKQHVKLTDVVSQNVTARLAQINDTLKTLTTDAGGFRVPTEKEMTAGLGLTPAQRKRVGARLAEVAVLGGKVADGPAALGINLGPHGQTLHLHGDIHITSTATNYGGLVQEIEATIQKKARRNATQTRGPNAGRNRGMT